MSLDTYIHLEEELHLAVYSYGPHLFARKLFQYNFLKSYEYDALIRLSEYLVDIEFVDVLTEVLLNRVQDLKLRYIFEDLLKTEKLLNPWHTKIDIVGWWMLLVIISCV